MSSNLKWAITALIVAWLGLMGFAAMRQLGPRTPARVVTSAPTTPASKAPPRRAVQPAVERVAPAAVPKPPESGVTLANYERVTTGMSYEEATAILGRGTEISRSEMMGITTVMYMWEGSRWTGANMNAMFQNNKLISKAQLGLR